MYRYTSILVIGVNFIKIGVHKLMECKLVCFMHYLHGVYNNHRIIVADTLTIKIISSRTATVKKRNRM